MNNSTPIMAILIRFSLSTLQLQICNIWKNYPGEDTWDIVIIEKLLLRVGSYTGMGSGMVTLWKRCSVTVKNSMHTDGITNIKNTNKYSGKYKKVLGVITGEVSLFYSIYPILLQMSSTTFSLLRVRTFWNRRTQ